MSLRFAWRSMRMSWKRLEQAPLLDFSRVMRPADVNVLDPDELGRTLGSEEMQELEEDAQLEERWLTMQDKDFGGLSSCSFKLSSEEGGKAVFSGTLSNDLGATQKQDFERSGYCAAFHKIHAMNRDISDFNALEIVFKSDTRQYLVNIEPESFIPNELYQGVLMCPEEDAGTWQTAILPFHNLILTGRGRIKATQRVFDYEVINTIGFTLAGEQPGDFKLELKQLNVINADDATLRGFNLKSPIRKT